MLGNAVKQMAHLQLDTDLERKQVFHIVAFLRSLSDKPRARAAAAKRPKRKPREEGAEGQGKRKRAEKAE